MIQFRRAFLFLTFVFAPLAWVQADWTTDYQAALVQAKAQKKLLLLDFTGSDWCGYCQLLDKEVFTQPAFKDFADKNYIAVTVDFPHQTQLPDDVKKQNDALNDQFKIDGFPTLIVLDADGKELGRQVGYDPGSGPTAVIAKLKSFQPKAASFLKAACSSSLREVPRRKRIGPSAPFGDRLGIFLLREKAGVEVPGRFFRRALFSSQDQFLAAISIGLAPVGLHLFQD
jgi:thioredoxin-related protein